MRLMDGVTVPCLILTAMSAWGAPVSALSAPSAQAVGADSNIGAIRREVEGGGTSCRRLVAAYLRRISRTDSRLHSIIAVNRRAKADARRIDALTQDKKEALPLLCTPTLVKDNIDVAGMPTTAGSVALKHNVAAADALAVTRLRQAGAIILAKTNMSEFAFNYRGHSSIRGQTRSPFSGQESAGGSSSGNASALAAGLGVVALGTDTSGSVRVPAALTGTIGLRPGFGTVPMGGVAPLSPTQDVIGPMCRQVEDCERVMAVLAPDVQAVGEGSALAGLRVGVLDGLMRPDGVAEQAALTALRQQGVAVDAVRLRDEAVLVGQAPPAGETARFASRSAFDFPAVMDGYLPARQHVPGDARDLLRRLQTLAAHRRTDPRVVEDVAQFSANRDGEASDPRFRINAPVFRDHYVSDRIDEAFDCHDGHPCIDVLVYAPVQQVSAPADKGPDTGGTHRLAAYSGRPAIAFPIGTALTPAGRRPVSLEIMGRRGSEARLMAIVAAWQILLTLPQAHACPAGGALLCLAH